MNLAIIVPAFNEAAYLPATLDALYTAAEHLHADSDAKVDVVVVDNNSTDETAAVAQSKGAAAVHEPVQGIARARNAGARHTQSDVLVFVDADALVPPALLSAIHDAMSDPACVGGGVDVEYRPERRSVRLYLHAWRLLALRMRLVQGATQFCRRSVFDEIGGYDERAWIGEDVDFYRGLERYAKRTGGTVRLIDQPRVQASARRSTSGPSGRRCSGRTRSSSRCSVVGRRFGRAGTGVRFGRRLLSQKRLGGSPRHEMSQEVSSSVSYGTTQVTVVPRPEPPDDTSSVPPICSASVVIFLKPWPCSA